MPTDVFEFPRPKLREIRGLGILKSAGGF